MKRNRIFCLRPSQIPLQKQCILHGNFVVRFLCHADLVEDQENVQCLNRRASQQCTLNSFSYKDRIVGGLAVSLSLCTDLSQRFDWPSSGTQELFIAIAQRAHRLCRIRRHGNHCDIRAGLNFEGYHPRTNHGVDVPRLTVR